MTITLEGKEKERVIGVTSETKFTKDGKPATFGDVATGENVRGQVKKTPEGNIGIAKHVLKSQLAHLKLSIFGAKK